MRVVYIGYKLRRLTIAAIPLAIFLFMLCPIVVSSVVSYTATVSITPLEIGYFLVGSVGPKLSKFDGTTWTSITPPPTMGTVYSIGFNGNYWLIGDSNKYVWEWDGQTFTNLHTFNDKVRAIDWGPNCWLVGDDGGNIKKYDGTSWTDLTGSAGFQSQGSGVYAIKWDSTFDYWLVSGKSLVKKYDGTSWTDVSPTARQFEGWVEAVGCNGVYWLVGDTKGVIQKYSGSAWTDLTSAAGFYPNGDSIYAIEWSGPQSKFLVGAKNGKVKTYDGSTWVDKSSGWDPTGGYDVYSIGWSTVLSYWLVGGKNGRIKSFDGTTWTDRTSDAGFTSDVYAIKYGV